MLACVRSKMQMLMGRIYWQKGLINIHNRKKSYLHADFDRVEGNANFTAKSKKIQVKTTEKVHKLDWNINHSLFKIKCVFLKYGRIKITPCIPA